MNAFAGEICAIVLPSLNMGSVVLDMSTVTFCAGSGSACTMHNAGGRKERGMKHRSFAALVAESADSKQDLGSKRSSGVLREGMAQQWTSSQLGGCVAGKCGLIHQCKKQRGRAGAGTRGRRGHQRSARWPRCGRTRATPAAWPAAGARGGAPAPAPCAAPGSWSSAAASAHPQTKVRHSCHQLCIGNTYFEVLA